MRDKQAVRLGWQTSAWTIRSMCLASANVPCTESRWVSTKGDLVFLEYAEASSILPGIKSLVVLAASLTTH
jgi:hypothetical protein